jgi:hypothetical protein
MKNLIINGHPVEVREDKTDIFGLSFLPQMTGYDNNEDWSSFTKTCSAEVSSQNYKLVESITKNYMTHGILEIGISRNEMGSFTQAIFQSKPDHIKYLGVDLDDKTYLDNDEKNIFTIKENSFNRSNVKSYAKKIGLEKISILFIDGWHSLNAVINDWQYVDMLSDNGIVIFHDSNYHPGPTVFVEAIDNSIFRVEKHFEGQDDYGVAIAYRIQK